MTYPIPDAALAHHTILLGKTRAGKSSAMRGAMERLLDQGKPVGIIDPKGDWWGIKSSADGKKQGYPVIIFGGEHGDVPINEHSGTHVAELVATGNRPFIIDLGGWMVGPRTRFFIDFASAFFRHSRGPRYLGIDEVHNFAPQGRVLDPDSGKMLHWANRLASEGSGRGITLLSASQRPQKVHKDYVTSHETLIAMRVIHPLDRGAVKEWIDGCPDPALGKEVMGSLASLDRGEAWVWSPEAKFGPVRIRFPMFKTYDSFAAPTTEVTEKLPGWANVDLDEVNTKLESVVEQAKANDPKLLRAEIADLKRKLAAADKGGAPTWPDQREEVASLSRAASEWRERAEAAEFAIETALGQLCPQGTDIEPLLARNRIPAPAVETRPLPPGRESRKPEPRHSPVPARPVHSTGEPSPPAKGDGSLTGPQRRVLNALAWWQAFGIAQPSSEQVAFIAGYSASSSTFANLKGAMRAMGLVEYPRPGCIGLTDEGAAGAEHPRGEISREAFHDAVRAKLSGPQQRMLDPLIEAWPEAMLSNDLAEAAGYSGQSSTFANLRGNMRTLGFVGYPSPGCVRAADWLFP